MRLRPLLSALLLPSIVSAWQCEDVSAGKAQYDLGRLSGQRHTSQTTETPPTTVEARVKMNLCGKVDREGNDEDQVSGCEGVDGATVVRGGHERRPEGGMSDARTSSLCIPDQAVGSAHHPPQFLASVWPTGSITPFMCTILVASTDTPSQCPDGTHICLQLVNHKESASEKERVTAVIPLWKEDTPDQDIRISTLGQGLRLDIKSDDYAG